jgi:hypothetical protein
MQAYGVEIWLHAFLTSVLDGNEWSASRPGRFTSKENSGTHWIGGRVGPRAGLDVVAKIKSFPERNPAPVVQLVPYSLYWLSYIGSFCLFAFPTDDDN